MKVTQWFDGNTRPVHVGWYQRKTKVLKEGFGYWYFDGAEWKLGGWHIPTDWVSSYTSPVQSLPWRGISK